jgi:hypothetical protein
MKTSVWGVRKIFPTSGYINSLDIVANSSITQKGVEVIPKEEKCIMYCTRERQSVNLGYSLEYASIGTEETRGNPRVTPAPIWHAVSIQKYISGGKQGGEIGPAAGE